MTFFVWYLLMGAMLGCFMMAQPGIVLLERKELQYFLATCFLMWWIIIIGMIMERFQK